MSVCELQDAFNEELGFTPSDSTISRARRNLGWIKSGPRYCQLVSAKNCEKRLEFAITCVRNRDKFENVIFTDESSIWFNCYNAVCFRKIGQEGHYKPKAKHPFKVTCLGWNNYAWCYCRIYIYQNHECSVLRRKHSGMPATSTFM